MRLYKFLSVEHAIDNLFKKRIKISEYQDMNDPFELDGYKLVSPGTPKALLARYREIMLGTIREGGAICFSETFAQPLLWSHYGDKHRGCCVAFDVADGDHVRQPILCDRKPEIQIDMLSLFKAQARHGGRVPESGIDPEFDSLLAEHSKNTDKIMLSKFVGWKYEEERRILIHLQPGQKDGNLYFAELDENIKPVEVLLGARCEPDTEKKFSDAVNSYDPPLPVSRTGFSADTFEVIRS
jgi:hypothetical protein